MTRWLIFWLLFCMADSLVYHAVPMTFASKQGNYKLFPGGGFLLYINYQNYGACV